MKKLKYLFIALMAVVLLAGCKGEKKRDRQPTANPNLIEPQMNLSKDDTLQVRRLTRQYLNRLEQKDLAGAMSMLRYWNHEQIEDLPVMLAQKEAQVLSMFLGMKAEIDHIIFFKDYDSEVKYTVTMFERTDENDHRPNKASFLLRPVRYKGQWYLTLADKQTDKVKSEIKH